MSSVAGEFYIVCGNIGIEDITFEGNAKESFVHHAGWEDDGAYKPVDMIRLVNSWIRRVRFTSVSEACSIVSCANVSAYDIEFTGNRGHAAVRSQASSRVFIGATTDRTSGYADMPPYVRRHQAGCSSEPLRTEHPDMPWTRRDMMSLDNTLTMPDSTMLSEYPSKASEQFSGGIYGVTTPASRLMPHSHAPL